MTRLPVPYGQSARQNSIEESIDEALAASQCCFWISDVMRALTYDSDALFTAVVQKAMQACVTRRVPVQHHFRSVFVAGRVGVRRDYRLSRFACYLITMNADPRYPAVAEAQIRLAVR